MWSSNDAVEFGTEWKRYGHLVVEPALNAESGHDRSRILVSGASSVPLALLSLTPAKEDDPAAQAYTE